MKNIDRGIVVLFVWKHSLSLVLVLEPSNSRCENFYLFQIIQMRKIKILARCESEANIIEKQITSLENINFHDVMCDVESILCWKIHLNPDIKWDCCCCEIHKISFNQHFSRNSHKRVNFQIRTLLIVVLMHFQELLHTSWFNNSHSLFHDKNLNWKVQGLYS